MRYVTFFLAFLLISMLIGPAALAESGGRGRGQGNQGGGAAQKGRGRTEERATQAEQDAEDAVEKADKAGQTAKEKVKETTETAEGKAKDADEAAPKKIKAAKLKPAAPTQKAAADVKGKGAGKAQRAEAVARQIEHEGQKHQRRQERLREMLAVAEQKGDEKIIERIKSLMEKENGRYEKKQPKMLERQSQETPAESEE